MSGDEMVVMVACVAVTALTWLGWVRQIARVSHLASSLPIRLLVSLAPVAGAFLLLAVLRKLASHDVRNSPTYLAFYLVMGAAWAGGATRLLLPFFGLSARDDLAERGNWAAAWATAGAVLGLWLAFAGANIGDGPGWWVVVFSAALSTAGLFLVWYALALATRVIDTVTVDRDAASGLRVAGFMVAEAVILGAAVAGDWVSAGATLHDFVLAAWPALPVLVLAMILERLLRPSAEQPARSAVLCGALPALLYVSSGLAAVVAYNAWARSTRAW